MAQLEWDRLELTGCGGTAVFGRVTVVVGDDELVDSVARGVLVRVVELVVEAVAVPVSARLLLLLGAADREGCAVDVIVVAGVELGPG